MSFQRPCSSHYEPCDPTPFLFSTNSSSTRSSSSPSPSPQSIGALDQVFGSMNPYAGALCYDAPMYNPSREPPTSYIQPTEFRLADQYVYDAAYICVSPPDLQIPASSPTFLPQTQQRYQTPQQAFKNQFSHQIMLPGPSQSVPVDLPKRKGDRALARLQRSAIDPDRHWACTHCIQKFARKSDLTRHIKRHAGRKDYPCTAPCCPLPLEERAFFRADARRRHWSKSPACEVAFYKTPEGIAWSKKNGNRRGVLLYREDNDNEDLSDESDVAYTD